ncbi:MAG: ABC transporter ATP-binding protein [Pelagibacterium sp.]|uniref:ABC transporter ATP-binding protein n=1 Tax=Pelagibacterium sp. TaxID=1967288 RepID=UPI0032EC810C
MQDAAATKTAKLQVRELEKRYGPVKALRPTTLEVGNGEFLTLLGPSGSGKTTLLMLVAGLVSPHAGEILIDGKVSTYIPPQKRDIGVVFQNYALFPHLSVFENVAFPLRMRRMPTSDIEREVKRVLDIVDLPQMADRLPKELSGGQQQRVALARCAVYQPSIILMDEPLGALDKKLRDSMQLEIKHLHRALGATVLYVTHDQGEAMSMSDRVCIMRDGGIEQIGTPADLYHRPANRFVGDFLGGASFLSTTVAGQEDSHIVVKTDDGAVIRARKPSAGTAAGEPALCMVRPQHLTIAHAPDSSRNSLPATIKESVMTGTMTEHYAALSDGTTVSAVELTSPETQVLAHGAKVHVTWKPEDTLVFAGEQLK